MNVSGGPVVTIGLSSHRLEALPYLKEEMGRHEAIALEEAPEPDFPDFLAGTKSASEYLADKEVEFPEFSRHQLALLREFHEQHKTILQIEPYQERLIRIHELLAQGLSPEKVRKMPELQEVYEAERAATQALLNFYRLAHTAPFPRVVAAVKAFVQADAARFRLRDELRAQALAELVGRFASLYVEAGFIHVYLVQALARRVKGRVRLRPRFLLASRSLDLLRRPHPFGPGDILTLKAIFGRPLTQDQEDLLAARSLIYIQLLTKGELAPGSDPTPHLSEEIQAVKLTSRLSLPDCARLYPEIRRATPEEAKKILKRHLDLSP